MRRSSAPESTSTVMMVAVMPEVRLLPLGMRRRPGEPLFTLVCFPVGQTGYILDTGSVITPIRIDGAQAFYNSLDMCLWLRIDGVLDRGGLGGGLSGDCHREGANCQGSHDAGDDFLHGHNVSLRRGHLQRGAGSRVHVADTCSDMLCAWAGWPRTWPGMWPDFDHLFVSGAGPNPVS